MSIGGILIMGEKSKSYGVAEYIATKAEVNPLIISTLKNAKSI